MNEWTNNAYYVRKRIACSRNTLSPTHAILLLSHYLHNRIPHPLRTVCGDNEIEMIVAGHFDRGLKGQVKISTAYKYPEEFLRNYIYSFCAQISQHS